MGLEWYDEPAAALSAYRLHEILELRVRVFIVEQECAYQEVDGRDLLESSRHLWGSTDGSIVAYARLLGPDADGVVHIGRVIVSAAGRGTGLGHELLDRALASCRTHWPSAGIALAAQAHLQRFYESHGFVVQGPSYDEDGIAHVDMTWRG